MRITRRQLKFLIREHLLLSEAHDPGEVVQVGPVSVLIYGRYDVGTAPFYLVYLPKGTKLDGNDVMTPTDSDIDGWIKNKRVTWGKQANGSSWKENPQRLKKLAKEGRFKFLNDFAKAKGINVGGAGGAYKTFATDIGLEAVGALGETFAGIAASVGAAPVAAAAKGLSDGANVTQFVLKAEENNWTGAFLALLGLLPAGDHMKVLIQLTKTVKVLPTGTAKAFAELVKKVFAGDLKNTVEQVVNDALIGKDITWDSVSIKLKRAADGITQMLEKAEKEKKQTS